MTDTDSSENFSIDIPSLDTTIKQIQDIIVSNLNQYRTDLLGKISEEYSLNLSELEEKYSDMTVSVIDDDCNKSIKTRRSRRKNKPCRDHPPEIKCIALTKNLTRCTRKKQSGINFCGHHHTKQPYGVVSDESFNESSDFLYEYRGNRYLKDREQMIYTIPDTGIPDEPIDFSSLEAVGWIDDNGMVNFS